MKPLLLAWIPWPSPPLAAPPPLAADAVRETRVATGFSRIEIDGQADVILRQGASEGVTIEAAAQALRQIETEVQAADARVSR